MTSYYSNKSSANRFAHNHQPLLEHHYESAVRSIKEDQFSNSKLSVISSNNLSIYNDNSSNDPTAVTNKSKHGSSLSSVELQNVKPGHFIQSNKNTIVSTRNSEVPLRKNLTEEVSSDNLHGSVIAQSCKPPPIFYLPESDDNELDFTDEFYSKQLSSIVRSVRSNNPKVMKKLLRELIQRLSRKYGKEVEKDAENLELDTDLPPLSYRSWRRNRVLKSIRDAQNNMETEIGLTSQVSVNAHDTTSIDEHFYACPSETKHGKRDTHNTQMCTVIPIDG